MGCGASVPQQSRNDAPRTPSPPSTSSGDQAAGSSVDTKSTPASPARVPRTIQFQRATSLKLPDLVSRKLEDPTLVLTPDEQLDVLRECIRLGEEHGSSVARGKDLLVVIGNTGAGKSTCVNYVDGCKLVKATPEGAAGTSSGQAVEGRRSKKVVRVATDSPVQELMKIGHSKKSQTFVPEVKHGVEFVYCDCSGFLDNRGAEINVANAVNIKVMVSGARSTKVLVLLNYNSLLDARGRGLRELADILISLFGSAEGLLRHRRSIALGIRQTHEFDTDGDIELENVRAEHFSELASLPPACREVVQALAPTMFLFSPHDSGNSSWLTREQMVTMLRNLEPIEDSRDIFKMC